MRNQEQGLLEKMASHTAVMEGFCTQQGIEASNLDGLYSFDNAKAFSRQYQLPQASGIYTGRETNLELIKIYKILVPD